LTDIWEIILDWLHRFFNALVKFFADWFSSSPPP